MESNRKGTKEEIREEEGERETENLWGPSCFDHDCVFISVSFKHLDLRMSWMRML